MSDLELDGLEAGLRRLQPSPVPPNLMTRLKAAAPAQPMVLPATQRSPGVAEIRLRLLRWLAPLTAAAALLVVLVLWRLHSTQAGGGLMASASPALKADDVQINHDLVGSFE